MDSEKRNPSNSAQDELDLGINQTTPTPRKYMDNESSFLNKAKNLFGKKEVVENKFTIRKEPTFGEESQPTFTPTHTVPPTEEPTTLQPTVTASTLSPQVSNTLEGNLAINEVPKEPSAAKQAEIFDNQNQEETIPVAQQKHQNDLNQGEPTVAINPLKTPEKWKVLQILPEKHRRLFIALLALILLLIIFLMLKPSSETVQSFEQNSSNEIPVQFQSLDQSQPLETTVLDNINNASSQKDTQPPAMEYIGESTNTKAVGNTTQSDTQPQQVPISTPTATKPAESVKTIEPIRPQSTQSQVGQQSQNTQKNTVSSIDTHKENVKTEESKTKVIEKKSTQNIQPSKKEMPPKRNEITVKSERKGAPIVEAKTSIKNTTVNTGTTVVSRKTLTIPQGVSLMQVFRDNQLKANISDINAMTKANGAGNALSSFRAGDKVQVSLNKQGKVSELRLPNGSRFIRQVDGSYQYKK
ncbi:opacity-associated protein OapA [Rodentibacter caecimuris]|uniref:Opacity-associated protein OapA n=1 Tax=Rodentibacter caecimuris TaxID=1796644 RepID=A0ABX3KZW6_9PAST|nr:hypothetical protein BKG89_02460 [Rodentibacter heylii]